MIMNTNTTIRAAAKISTYYDWRMQGTTGEEYGDQTPIAPLIGEKQLFEGYRIDF